METKINFHTLHGHLGITDEENEIQTNEVLPMLPTGMGLNNQKEQPESFSPMDSINDLDMDNAEPRISPLDLSSDDQAIMNLLTQQELDNTVEALLPTGFGPCRGCDD